MNNRLDGYIEGLIGRMKEALLKVNYRLEYRVTLEQSTKRNFLEIWFTFIAPSGSTLTTTMIVSDKKKENIRGLIQNFMYVALPRLGERYYSTNKEYSVTFHLPNTGKSIKVMFEEDDTDKVTILVGSFREEPLSVSEISVYDVFDVLIDIVELVKLAIKEV